MQWPMILIRIQVRQPDLGFVPENSKFLPRFFAFTGARGSPATFFGRANSFKSQHIDVSFKSTT